MSQTTRHPLLSLVWGGCVCIARCLVVRSQWFAVSVPRLLFGRLQGSIDHHWLQPSSAFLTQPSLTRCCVVVLLFVCLFVSFARGCSDRRQLGFSLLGSSAAGATAAAASPAEGLFGKIERRGTRERRRRNRNEQRTHCWDCSADSLSAAA